MNNSPYLFALSEKFRNFRNYKIEKNNKNGKNNRSIKFSPTSGSEPKFQPRKWNNEEVQPNHNCYAYVLNTIAPRQGKPQPGYFSGFPPLEKEDYNCLSFYQRLKKDIPSLYLTTFGEKCKKGFYKGFIAIDPKDEDQDYHFYRQDKSGYWSHKPGRQEAVNYDSNGKKIINPVKANRKYKYFDYSTACFFFCLNNKLARSRSKSRVNNLSNFL